MRKKYVHIFKIYNIYVISTCVFLINAKLYANKLIHIKICDI